MHALIAFAVGVITGGFGYWAALPWILARKYQLSERAVDPQTPLVQYPDCRLRPVPVADHGELTVIPLEGVKEHMERIPEHRRPFPPVDAALR